MSDATTPKPYTLEAGEKATPVMVYTLTTLARGEMITKEQLRVSTFLRTQAAPEFVGLYNAQVLVFGGPTGIQQTSYTEYFIPTQQILAYHLVPPVKDPVDYDLSEPNRKMEPATLLVGTFRFTGHIRMATQSNISKYLELARESFFSFYDAEITNPGLPSASALKVPIVLARLSGAAVASRSA
jgi:hypothetical protein